MIKLARLYAAALLLITTNAFSHTMLLTAEYSPSVINPGNNKFTNTTPVTGYCLQIFANCASRGYASIDMGLQTLLQSEIKRNDTVLFKMPSSARSVKVTNTGNGETFYLSFRILGFGANIYRGTHDGDTESWEGGRWSIPGSGGCARSNTSSGIGVRFTWFWLWGENDNTCSKRSTIDRGLSPTYFDSTNFMYELITPNPLGMPDGIYEGTLVYSVAASGSADILLGGTHFEPSTDNLTINFRLSVSHDLQVKPEGSTELTLHACQEKCVANKRTGKTGQNHWSVMLRLRR